jgi:hypothetical protein
MNIERLYKIVEEECRKSEDAMTAMNGDGQLELDGYVRALIWVLSVIEETSEEEEL